MGGNSTVIGKRFSKVFGRITETYPDLRITRVGKIVEIIGSLPITEKAVAIDRFQIRIEVDPSYPNKMPRVFEVGGRIPKVASRHISPPTGEACVCLKDQWGWLIAKYPKVLAFIEGPVNDFFLWQLCYDEFGEDRLGGWAHGSKGRLEFYKELLKTDDLNIIKTCLLHLSEPKYKANWICYCGSGKKVCQCHKVVIINLRSKISPGLATSAWKDIAALENGPASQTH